MYVETWNTDIVSKSLGMDSIGDILIDTSRDEEYKSHGMIHDRPHTESAKQKMRETGKPTLRKPVTLIKNGVINEFASQTAAGKYIGDSAGHINELTKGIRKTCKGWRLYGV